MSTKLLAALRSNNALIEHLIPNVRLGGIEFFVGEVSPLIRTGMELCANVHIGRLLRPGEAFGGEPAAVD